VAQMSTVGQVQAHKSIVRLHQRLVDLQIGGAATQALHIDAPLLLIQTKDLQCPLLALNFDLIDELITAIVTRTRITFGVLIAHGGPQRIVDGAGSDIFGGDEQDGLALPLDFLFLRAVSMSMVTMVTGTHHDLIDLRIKVHERLLQHLAGLAFGIGAFSLVHTCL
jgi:hypothetical protein